ncbi:5698_t:CDS:2, partial [Funneliformis caledonium]
QPKEETSLTVEDLKLMSIEGFIIYTYNALKTLRTCHASMWDDRAIINVHYIMADKPWNKEIINFEQEFQDVKETNDEEAISLFVLNSWWWKVWKGMEFSADDFSV